MNGAEESTLRGYRSISDITVDLDGKLAADIGWVIFEISDDQPDRGQGVVGTFNNYATLKLIGSISAQKPCRIHGRFDSGEIGINAWLLDDVVFTGMLLRDVSGIIGFRAGTVNRITQANSQCGVPNVQSKPGQGCCQGGCHRFFFSLHRASSK